ncbi:MAG: hypothetical protein DHS20C02_03260 [Micavibrio sp.]|nr:MAG: hypothetical protein DHS20C02_03260 [Micavibrio sp.]
MSFTLLHQETDPQGSFTAWGTGFYYQYDACTNKLSVIQTEGDAHLMNVALDGFSSDALAYAAHLEKTTQIKALMFSDCTTIDLTKTFDTQKITAIVRSAAIFAGYALDLERHHFRRFSRGFRQSCSLGEVYINSLYQEDPNTEFFKGFVKTKQGNAVCADGSSLTNILADLSDKIVQDLIAMEFGENHRRTAHKLLGASFKLSTTSRILDKNFIPCHKLAIIRDSAEDIKSRH